MKRASNPDWRHRSHRLGMLASVMGVYSYCQPTAWGTQASEAVGDSVWSLVMLIASAQVGRSVNDEVRSTGMDENRSLSLVIETRSTPNPTDQLQEGPTRGKVIVVALWRGVSRLEAWDRVG